MSVDKSQQFSVFDQGKGRDLRKSTDCNAAKVSQGEMFRRVGNTQGSELALPQLDDMVLAGGLSPLREEAMQYQSFGPRKITITKGQRRKLAKTIDFNAAPIPTKTTAQSQARSTDASHKKKKPPS